MFSISEAQEPLSVFPLAEKLKAIPGLFGIRFAEEPEYYVVRSSGDKEIRKYAVITLATVTVPVGEDPEEAKTGAFLILANYIFGKNKERSQIPMTAPVLRRETSELLGNQSGPGTLSMSFVLPGSYSLTNAPAPMDKRIVLHERPSSLVACLGYRGPNSRERIRKYSVELKKWVSQYPSYREAGEPQIAQYDGPATLDIFRKNEVQIELKTLH